MPECKRSGAARRSDAEDAEMQMSLCESVFLAAHNAADSSKDLCKAIHGTNRANLPADAFRLVCTSHAGHAEARDRLCPGSACWHSGMGICSCGVRQLVTCSTLSRMQQAAEAVDAHGEVQAAQSRHALAGLGLESAAEMSAALAVLRAPFQVGVNVQSLKP